MPATLKHPGVYIEEVPSGVRTIVGVSTSIGAFVGYFSRGPENEAVQVFSLGDFQREFGGLNAFSEASYGIQQFFLNGGSEAWVVRVTRNAATATVGLETDAGGAVATAMVGRRVRGAPVEDRGAWGSRVRIDVDFDTADLASDELFNLTVSETELQDGREVEVRNETYRNLIMDENANNYVIESVNEASRLIQFERDAALGLAAPQPRPASTGTFGVDASASVGSIANGQTFDVDLLDETGTGLLGGPVNAVVTVSSPVASLADVRTILENAIRDIGASASLPLLEGATVQLIGNRFRVLGDRSIDGFEPETQIQFIETGDNSATDMGLAGAGVSVNVQQYALGSTFTVASQAGGTAGVDGDLPESGELIGTALNETGFHALEDVDLFNILCIPRAADLADAGFAVYSAAETYCVGRRAFLIIDLPATTDNLQDAQSWLSDNATLRNRNAAAYFPRPRIPDPLNDFRLRSVGASGTMAGLYARTDSTRGVWKAPAGTESSLRGVRDLAVKLSDSQNGVLNPLGLNGLRTFDVHGNVAWGARTLDGADQQASEWKYVPVRRVALFIEESLFRGTQWVVFEPNDEPLWAQIRLNLGAFMQGLFLQGAFQGTTPREAYLVKCDSETTTQNDIDRGVVNILVGFAPLKPAEFVIIRIQQLAGQIQT